MLSSTNPFFSPRGIVVIGASANPTSLGHGVVRNLSRSGYRGAIHLVNPKGGTVLDYPVYPSVAEVPDPVDLAVLVIPAPAVSEAVEACHQRGIQAVIVLSGGFRESGPQGALLEDALRQQVQRLGLRLLGPNCVGLLDTHLPLDLTFLPTPLPPPGEIAFLTHSGALGAAILDWARQQGFSFSRLISLGNQTDLTETDFLPALADDPHTRVIALYLESLSEGRRFIEEARHVTAHKPIVALKAGRQSHGQRAAASHTGALASSDSAFQAAFEKAGILRANTAQELFEWSRALAWLPLPAGRRMAVLTNAGGPGVLATDALEAHGLTLADLSPVTLQALRALLPPAASPHNPVDMLASASPQDYAACLGLLLDDPNVDGVLVILPPPPMYPAENVAEAVIPIVQASVKPVVVALMGSEGIRPAWERFTQARVVTFPFPEQAASALACLVQRAEHLNRRVPDASLPPRLDHGPIASLLEEQPDSWLPPRVVAELLDAAHIPGVPSRLARTADEAIHLARELGFPLVLKIASPDIVHKTDVGGVFLNLRSADEVYNSFELAMRNARQAQPDARLEGCLLQPLIPDGVDLLIGATRDPLFGPLIAFGSGGVDVEGLGDVAFGLPPLSSREAEALLDRTWAGRKLRGWRSRPAADRSAVLDVLLHLAELVSHHPQIAEIEINPLRAHPQGVIALDARVRLERTDL